MGTIQLDDSFKPEVGELLDTTIANIFDLENLPYSSSMGAAQDVILELLRSQDYCIEIAVLKSPNGYLFEGKANNLRSDDPNLSYRACVLDPYYHHGYPFVVCLLALATKGLKLNTFDEELQGVSTS